MKKIIVPILLAIAISGCEQPQPNNFELTPEAALQKAVESNPVLSLAAFEKWKTAHTGNFLLIDLRSTAEGEANPLEDAVQMKVADLLDEPNLEQLRSKEHVVLSAGDLSLASNAWFLLVQTGFENVHVVDAWGELPGDNTAETARYDFAAIFRKAKERHEAEVEAGKPKPVVGKAQQPAAQPKPKKKKVLEEEGC